MKWCKDDVYRILFNQLHSLYWITEEESEMIDESVMGKNGNLCTGGVGSSEMLLIGRSSTLRVDHGDVWGGG